MQNYNFDLDFSLCREKYPRLEILWVDNQKFVSGFIPAINPETKKYIAIFSIKMLIPEEFPFCFPIVWDKGGIFPETADYHFNSDGTFCLDVKQNEIIKTKNGLSLQNFIDYVLIPNLMWRYCHLKGIPFAKNEWSHNFQGTEEFYLYYLDEKKIAHVIYTLGLYLGYYTFNRNDICFCKKSLKRRFKHCHEKKAQKLNLIGREQVLQDFKFFKSKYIL